ncbi:MAG TPA: hypothetical protein VMR21_03735 [Vicinamibacteria bacterium]|nr:hypothetical protein [Vicinamibacteria bacterium]
MSAAVRLATPVVGVAAIDAPIGRGRWLVSPSWDLAVFGGSALLAFALLVWGHATGDLAGATPPWAWVATVLAVDVAHVWSTAYRVYLDPDERLRRPGLYAGVPLAAYAIGVVLHSLSAALFWRVLAYLAVLHFVRQQYGWVALYRRRLGPTSRLDRILDDAAIYSATLYPLLWWHANLPREFAWFLEGDFIPGLPSTAASTLLPVHLLVTAAYAARQVWLLARRRPVSAGKSLVIATTWLTWYVGIVVLDSDYAFTVTNVLVHGIPYLALVWVYGRGRFGDASGALGRVFRARGWPLYLASLAAIAWIEEWGWDRLVWHERPALFPGRTSCCPGPPWPCWCPSWPCRRPRTTCSTPGSGGSRRTPAWPASWDWDRAYPNRSSRNGSPRMW